MITEVTLKLYPLPEAVSAAICHFPDIAGAVNATIQLIQMGVPIARCELLDVNAVRAVNAQSKLGLREAPMLLMEFHGSAASVQGAGRNGAGHRLRDGRRGLRVGQHARGAHAAVDRAAQGLLRRHAD